MKFGVYTVEEKSFINRFGVKVAWEEETGNSVVVDTNCTQSAFKKGQELFGKDAKIRIDDM